MHVRPLLALALAVPVLLAGCSEDAEPTPKMPEPTTSSSTPTPTESETPQAESPEDFVRRWVEVGDEMQQTGKTTEFRKLSRKCQACADVAKQVESIYDAGGSIEFAGSTVSLLKRVADAPPTFHLDLRTPETIIREANGEEQRLPAGTGMYLVTLNGKPGEWFVAHYGRR